jgi:hypothetical protein
MNQLAFERNEKIRQKNAADMSREKELYKTRLSSSDKVFIQKFIELCRDKRLDIIHDGKKATALRHISLSDNGGIMIFM